MGNFDQAPKAKEEADDNKYLIDQIPPQYKGMTSEALEVVWVSPNAIAVTIDGGREEHNKELARRKEILNALRNQEIKNKLNDIYFKNRNGLYDEMFSVSHGLLPDGTIFEKIDGEIGQHFDAHGISKVSIFTQYKNLINILDNGIDKNKTFYTAPFEIPNDKRQAMASAMGTSGGTAYKDGLAILISGYNQSIQENGIKYVFINDIYNDIVDNLQKIYPNYRIHKLSEQKAILEQDKAEWELKNKQIK